MSKPTATTSNSNATDSQKVSIKELLGRAGPLLGLILMMIFISINTDKFFTYDNAMNLIRQGMINSMLSIGMMFCLLSGNIDLSMGSITGLSVVAMGMSIQAGMNPFVSMAICLVTGILCGVLNGVILTKFKIFIPFIVTFSTQNIFRGLCLVLTNATPISGMGSTVRWLGSQFIGSTGIPVVIIFIVAIYIITSLFLNRTALGRKIYAVGGNKTAAQLSGINTDNVTIFCYIVSGLTAGLGAIMLAGRVDAAYPQAGLGYEGDAIAAVVIGGTSFSGGRGNIAGTVVGVLLITVLRNGLNLMKVQTDVQTIVLGCVIIGAVMIDIVRSGAFSKVKKIDPDKQAAGGAAA